MTIPIHRIPLRPLSPRMHARYAPVLWPSADGTDPLPPDVRTRVTALVAELDSAAEERIDPIEREIVAATYWYALRPDEIARDVLQLHRWRSPLSVAQATLVLAAIGEAGYPIHGNGAPTYLWSPYGGSDPDLASPPTRGEERDRVIWSAAEYWARAASRHLTYVSLGDCRGYLPRPVQYDQPGSMHPQQRAALTFGPLRDRGDECDSHAYMRRHTRRLILVREED